MNVFYTHTRHRRLFPPILLLCLFLFSSCIFDSFDPEKEESQNAVLVLHIGTIGGQTRALGPDNIENITSLRIVLIDADKKEVEYNRHWSFPQIGFDEFNQQDGGKGWMTFIETTPGEKKIYIIANEENTGKITSEEGPTYTDLSTLLNSAAASVGSGATAFETLINSVSFTPDFNHNIVLSSYYEFNVDENNFQSQSGSRRLNKDFWLVRAAAKFEFEFVNNCPNPLHIDELTVSSVADNMFLMPHVEDDFETGNMKNPLGKSYENWIEWLNDVCTATNNDQSWAQNPDVNNEYGWIKKYSLPSSATHKGLNILSGIINNDNLRTIPSKENINDIHRLPQVYCAESKNSGQGNTEQQYKFTVKLTDGTYNTSKAFTETLTNLQALFRNTYMKVRVTIDYQEQDMNLTLQYGICKWTEETIDIPTFD